MLASSISSTGDDGVLVRTPSRSFQWNYGAMQRNLGFLARIRPHVQVHTHTFLLSSVPDGPTLDR